MDEEGAWSCHRLRAHVSEWLGYDPGALTGETPLSDCGLTGLNLLVIIRHLELVDGVVYPAHLISSLESVDDLLYYANIKLAQLSRSHDAAPE